MFLKSFFNNRKMLKDKIPRYELGKKKNARKIIV